MLVVVGDWGFAVWGLAFLAIIPNAGYIKLRIIRLAASARQDRPDSEDRNACCSFLVFLNVAVDQLYGELPENRIRMLLSVGGLPADNLEMLTHVVDNAKVYFRRPEDFDRAWQEELGDDQ